MNHLQLLGTITGLIVGAIAVAGVVWKIMLPRIDERIREHLESNNRTHEDFESRIVELEEKKVRDYERLQRHDATDQAIMGALFAILEHLRTKNADALITGAISELQAHLIKHS